MNKISHLAVIMDGNGRWAQQRKLPRTMGHKEGLKKAEEIIDWCLNNGVKCLSLYVFSTENWARPKGEVDQLFKLAGNYLNKFAKFCRDNIRVIISGSRDGLDEKLVNKMAEIESKTAQNSAITVNLCMNYGGQQEIANVCSLITESGNAITKESIDSVMFAKMSPPEVVVRTGGHNRLSNFMLYQIAYAELFFTDTLWPDFSTDELQKICDEFAHCSRNFGGLTNG